MKSERPDNSDLSNNDSSSWFEGLVFGFFFGILVTAIVRDGDEKETNKPNHIPIRITSSLPEPQFTDLSGDDVQALG